MEAWFNPEPKIEPVRLPRQIPKRVVPSYIGEQNLVGNYLIYLGGGDSARDYSGRGNHGSFVGSPEWLDGFFGWSLDFPGTDGVEIPDDPSLRITGDLTIHSWVKKTADQDRCLVQKNYNYEYEIYLRDSGYDNVIRFMHGDGSWVAYDSNVGIPPDEWFLVSVVRDSSAGEVRFYKDGSFDVARSYTVTVKESTTSVSFPYRSQTDAQYLDCRIGDLKILARAVTDAEVSDFFEETRSIYGK